MTIDLKMEHSAEEQRRVVNMSYESYFMDAVKSFKEMNKYENQMFVTENKYIQTSKLLKAQYATRSTESEEQNKGFFRKFKENITKWFMATLEFIVKIIHKIADIVVQLIKSVILYIQKKRLRTKSILTLAGKNENNLYSNINESISLIRNNKFKIKTLSDTGIRGAKDYITFDVMHKLLNNPELKNFINDNSIYLQNKSSVLNLDFIDRVIKTDFANMDDLTTEEKLSSIEKNVQHIAADAIVAGELSIASFPMGIPQKITMHKYGDYLIQGNIKEFINSVCFNTPDKVSTMVGIADFMGIVPGSNIEVSWMKNRIRELYSAYIKDYYLVLGENGYIPLIEQVIKTYTKTAKEDKAKIKELTQYLRKQIDAIKNQDFNNPNNQKALHIYRRFTKILMNVSSIKSKFIALRQYLIGNIIAMFSAEDRLMGVLLNIDSTNERDENIMTHDQKYGFADKDIAVFKHRKDEVHSEFSGMPDDFFNIKDSSVEHFIETGEF